MFSSKYCTVNSGVGGLSIRAKTLNGIDIRKVTNTVPTMILLRLLTAKVLQVTTKIGNLNWANKDYSKLAQITGTFPKSALRRLTVFGAFFKSIRPTPIGFCIQLLIGS